MERHAEVYLFAWHPISEVSRVDHRVPQQWQFFHLPKSRLPQHKRTIGSNSGEDVQCQRAVEAVLKACPPSSPPLTYVSLPAYSALLARALWIVGSTSNVQTADLARSVPAGRAFFAKKEGPLGERGRRRR